MSVISKRLSVGARGGLLSTRAGLVAAAVMTALAAGVVMLVFLGQYRRALTDPTPAQVLVANKLIEKGSPGNVIATTGASTLAEVRTSQLHEGAITDPAVLRGMVAKKDVYPGEQLTSADFTKATSPLQGNLSGTDRALAVPLDNAHGLIGQVKTGDRVDVMGGFNLQSSGDGRVTPSLRFLATDVLVLDAPEEPKGGLGAANQAHSVLIRVTDEESAEIALASDTGKVWLALRPRVGARSTHSSYAPVTLEKLLSGIKPFKMTMNISGSGR